MHYVTLNTLSCSGTYCTVGVGGTHHSHLAEGALHTVGHGHSGWTHVSVSLYKVVDGPAYIKWMKKNNINNK